MVYIVTSTVSHTLSPCEYVCLCFIHFSVKCGPLGRNITIYYPSPDQDSLWTNILNVILLKSLAFKPSFVFLFLRGTFSSNSALNILSQLKKKAKNLFFPDYKMNSCPFKSKHTKA